MPAPGKIFVPPGGFMGFAQQSIATQALITTRAPARKKRSKRKTTTKKTAKRRRPAAKTGKRLVKGSAEAKARMAKLRKMRKK